MGERVFQTWGVFLQAFPQSLAPTFARPVCRKSVRSSSIEQERLLRRLLRKPSRFLFTSERAVGKLDTTIFNSQSDKSILCSRSHIYNRYGFNSLIITYRPISFLACLWTSTSFRSINTQKKNLANVQPS